MSIVLSSRSAETRWIDHPQVVHILDVKGRDVGILPDRVGGITDPRVDRGSEDQARWPTMASRIHLVITGNAIDRCSTGWVSRKPMLCMEFDHRFPIVHIPTGSSSMKKKRSLEESSGRESHRLVVSSVKVPLCADFAGMRIPNRSNPPPGW